MLALALLGACSDSVGDSADAAARPDANGGAGALSGPPSVRLPAIDVGEAAPSADLVLTSDGVTGALELSATGPFEVNGSLAPLDGATPRVLEVVFTGATTEPGNHAGAVAITQGDQTLDIPLAGAVLDPALPATVSWNDDGYGVSAFVPLPSAPYPESGGSWTDPTVWIWVPHDLSAPFATITHLHGHNAVLADMLASKQLPALFAAAARNAIVIAPQGPVSAASGDFGKLMEAGGHEALVRDVIGLAYREGIVDIPDTDGVVLTSHSGGYLATARIIEQGGLPVDEVHLYDSLYGELSVFLTFATDGGVLRSTYTATGGTDANNLQLAAMLTGAGVAVSDDFSDGALRSSRVTIGATTATHDAVMRDDRNLQRWLQASLPPHRGAPPELLAARSDGSTATVTWRDEGLGVIVEGSSDGDAWELLGTGVGGTASVAASPLVRVRLADGAPSDEYAASGGDWLVVDGFDRFAGGSYRAHTHPFAGKLGGALGAASAACNEAVAEGLVLLSDYDAVLWMLGDESTDDRTFSAAERAAVEAFVAGGGTLIVSGAEVGFATDSAFFAGTLHATYVADDAGTTMAGGYQFGVAYPEDFPDVLSGDVTVWSYATGGAAAVSWNEQVVVVGFPLETLADADLGPAIADLLTAVGQP